MKATAGELRLSASDLSNHLACGHLTSLDLAVATAERAAPTWHSPDAWILQQRGMEHEQAYLDHLAAAGVNICDLREIDSDDTSLAKTVAAMQQGVEAIAQATLANGRWFGRADILRRVESPSNLGSWSYEVYDCKLAHETKAATILQLSMYSELIAQVQGLLPDSMYVIPPSENFQSEQYRVADFAAYYRYVKARLEAAVGKTSSTYPEPTAHCDVCRWWRDCDTERRRDDHLSLVAGISKLQRKQWKIWDTETVVDLARFPLPIRDRPAHGSKDSYVRVREQARVQVQGREESRPVHEVLELTENHGLSLLPEPSPGDIFFDLEGDPFVGLSGREYLFGIATPDYECRWALNSEDEKAAFQWFVQTVMDRWAQHPAMHIYHFAPYEPSAVKRLMGRYAVCEDEIDRMLRAKLFVDLHTVVKRSVRASVEKYSLKALEAFHGFKRRLPLEHAGTAMRQMQHALELGRTAEAPVKDAIALYNADDCLSTLSLRDWLESMRAGRIVSRPEVTDGGAPDKVNERQQKSAALAASLTANIPAEPTLRTEEEKARCLLANLLDWHRREFKVDYWEYFRLKDLPDEDLLNERAAIAGLEFVETLEVANKIPTDRYRFEKQETSLRIRDKVCTREENFGTVVGIDIGARIVDFKKMKKTAAVHPASVFINKRSPDYDELADALIRLGSWVQQNGIDSPGPHRAARDLLLRHPPRLRNMSPLAGADPIKIQLDNSVLAIQGPPGAGKTFTGAHMICELVKQGKKVGITANSHKVIRNLLDEVIKADPVVRCMQKVRDKTDDLPNLAFATDNDQPLAALQNGTQVIAGTSWMWSREDYFEAVDVLFVDEAGQMSLANVLALSQAAKGLVLLGDPQQLEQPLKGSHPEGADVSALEHILAGSKTITSEKGIFLESTWRLHPNLCKFTSEVFYEGRLHSHAGLENQRITGHPWLGESGLWFIPVHHEGNQNSAPEEVERIAGIVDTLLQPGVNWVDEKGTKRPLVLNDILIIAPYNAQVSDLGARLPGARIGTVDKFQGQQGPVVIYSLTTSSPEDAPRGMEFLYSLNRLNVATSRAQAMVIVVGNPRLLEPECKSPRQMQLANALCRYAELAQFADSAVQTAPASS